MLTLIKHVAHSVPAAKLMVGDVIATKGTCDNPMRLRRVDLLAEGELLVSTPRNGGDVEAISFGEADTFVVAGRVEDHVSAKPKKVAPKPKATATAKNPAPVKRSKTVKVDAVAQTTPIHAPANRVERITRQPKAAPSSSIRDEIRSVIREAVTTLIVTEVKALVAEALA